MNNNRSKPKLNIAMLGHKRIPSREGGVEIVVEELSTRLAERGHTVTCYNRTGHHVAGAEYDEESHRKEYNGVALKKVFTIDKGGLAALTSSVFATIKAAFGRYDVIHIHAEGPAVLCWLPRLLGKRVIVTVHGLDWARAKWGRLASLYIRTGEKMAVKYANEIVVLSENVRQYFKTTYNRPTHYIPNGVNERPHRPAEQITEQFGLTPDSYILYLGRLVPEKGEKYLIEAFRRVKTDKKLVIAGGSSDTGTFAQELRELAKGDDRILFTGFVQGRLKHELYSNAYVYTLPSDLEGMPLSLLEAMSYGSCCLTSDIPECAEVVEDKAVLFRKSDVDDLTEKLQMLCDRPDVVEELKADARPYICGKYNWNDVVEKTIAIYRG